MYVGGSAVDALQTGSLYSKSTEYAVGGIRGSSCMAPAQWRAVKMNNLPPGPRTRVPVQVGRARMFTATSDRWMWVVSG